VSFSPLTPDSFYQGRVKRTAVNLATIVLFGTRGLQLLVIREG
jgi:hypothetical protein